MIKIIGKQGKDFDRINVYFLINGFSNHDKEKLEINDVDVFVHTWDVARLFKINETNSVHEPIEIDFEKFTEEGKGLQCLQVPSIDEMYDCYLAIVPGEVLANLYKEFSNELLESNVRAFLGQAGKFNKGIRDTIRTKPQMFLPYNNGITATAESVETKLVDGQTVITRLNDFQIVNGGQTTASLYHTQKKFKEARNTLKIMQDLLIGYSALHSVELESSLKKQVVLVSSIIIWIYVNILDTIFFVFYEYFFSNSIGLKYPNLL